MKCHRHLLQEEELFLFLLTKRHVNLKGHRHLQLHTNLIVTLIHDGKLALEHYNSCRMINSLLLGSSGPNHPGGQVVLKMADSSGVHLPWHIHLGLI